MTYLKLDRFAGTAPVVSPRLLSEKFGQIAENVDLESGRLVATKDDVDAYTLQNAARRSIYYYRDTSWLEWSEEDVSVVPGPIPGDTLDRLYYTGDDYPRVGTVTTLVSGSSGYPVNSYRLGVPAPSAAPTIVRSGTADADSTPNDVSYVYTFVTAFGEEGPPSAPSAIVTMSDGQNAALTMAVAAQPSGNYNFGTGALKRVYRSNTGSTNTTFQFVDQVAYTATTYTDQKDAATLGEVLPSSTWIGPPDDNTSLYPDGMLKGLIPLSQGVMAGFTGKRFCLSEPFLPYAWPVNYRITTEEDIVAIASTANGVVALTDGQPYFITGTEPSAMTAIRVDLAQACVNTRSVVDMGDYVLYAGPDGLCAVESAQGQVISKGLVSVEQWNASYNPTTIRSFKHEGTYVAFHAGGGWVFDPRGAENALTTLTLSADVRGGYMNPKDGELYIIVGNKIRKYRGGTASKTLKFKTKSFTTASPTSMAWVSVDANAYPVTVKVYGDKALVAHYVVDNNLTYIVTVVSDGGNKYAIAGLGTTPVLAFQRGNTYTFDLSDASNTNHPLRFKTGDDVAYTGAMVVTGTAGNAGAKIALIVPANAPDTLKYYCAVHGNSMGNTINVVDSGASFSHNITVPSGISSGIIPEPIMRMPSHISHQWEIQVEGTDINEFCLAQSIEEIRGS